MRLIETSTLRLVTRHNGNIPPFAILSHTWFSEDDELTFQQYRDLPTGLTGRLKKSVISGPLANHVVKEPGFAKIRGATELAASRGWDYVWIDTVCIDKTSSAELSEAINSIYGWYRSASVCYAYLNDVEGLDGPESLRRIRRFEHGWTLQELIAPDEVEFYSNHWKYLGSKLGLLKPKDTLGRVQQDGPFAIVDLINPDWISAVTGINVRILVGSKLLDDMSVAQRMGWAARRKSTRLEDTARCSMRIFNVNMPLLYGEGERAFTRLQEEILKA